MAKSRKSSKTQNDKAGTVAGQEKATVEETAAAPKRMQGLLRLVRGGAKPRPEAVKMIQAAPGKSKEPASRIVRKESGKSASQFFKESVKFLQSAWGELKKVHWPTRQELVVYTAVVIGSVVFVALLIWIIDSILSQLLNYIL